jgi:hypothetical protein
VEDKQYQPLINALNHLKNRGDGKYIHEINNLLTILTYPKDANNRKKRAYDQGIKLIRAILS